jgi:hypothetical protein
MKKLILSVDALCVESFSTLPAIQGRRGTIEAHGFPRPPDNDDGITIYGCTFDQTHCNPTCAGDTCPYGSEMGAWTCDDQSCVGTCIEP